METIAGHCETDRPGLVRGRHRHVDQPGGLPRDGRTVPRRLSVHLFFRNSGAGRRPRHPQCAPRLDARLAQPDHRFIGWLMTVGRRVPHHRAAVRQLRRHGGRVACRLLHRRRHRPAHARRLPHVQRLCGVSAAFLSTGAGSSVPYCYALRHIDTSIRAPTLAVVPRGARSG